MLKLDVLEKLKQKGKTKYWLYKQMGMSYQNFNKMVNNQTKSIKFENLEALCDILECTPGDLFIYKQEQILKKKQEKKLLMKNENSKPPNT